jgi:biotin-(acetyl-CoA carboxylase) ligase
VGGRRGGRAVSRLIAIAMSAAPHLPAAFRLASWTARGRTDGFVPVRTAWLARAASVGTPIDVRLGSTLISGRFADLDQDGVMIIETANGARRRVTAGDIVETAALQAAPCC